MLLNGADPVGAGVLVNLISNDRRDFVDAHFLFDLLLGFVPEDHLEDHVVASMSGGVIEGDVFSWFHFGIRILLLRARRASVACHRLTG